MSDFHQNGVVTTLHRLSADGLERLETELKWYSRNRPIGLVLPALYSEFETPAMQRIVSELERVDYIRQTVVVLARASEADYERARMHFENFSHPVTVIWIDSERVQQLFQHLEERGLSAGEKRMLAKARQILVSELALAEKTNEDKAEALLDEVLTS